MSSDIATVWQQERRKVLATLIRLLGDFDRAEEALHDAFLAAAARWPSEGLPRNRTAWLVSAGRFRAIDRLRREARQKTILDAPALAGDQWLGSSVEAEADPTDLDDAGIEDDTLRLLFTCCHPDLGHEAQVALGLRTICGLTTEEIARAYLLRTPTLAQRIVRAKAHIRDAGLRYEIPSAADLPSRLPPVLRMLYLVFNEANLSTSHPQALRHDLSAEALRLCRLLVHRFPDPEVMGLLGLMLCHDARRSARALNGDLIPLEAQDRSLWDRDQIAEGVGWINHAFAARQIGPYAVQGAIAAVHATAPTFEDTNWAEILGLYEVLYRLTPSPVAQLNRAVALGKVKGPDSGLPLVESLLAEKDLQSYYLAHLAKAEMLRELNRPEEARAAYTRALDLCSQDAERRHLIRRMESLPE
ncbi:RNA polymerase sigma factor [Thioclava sp. FR2]|uniref:RNA polymerase sigma factor n=1 Tax=Thioclava sp. FR2 TaxID=3445780 RepID=UPI003EB89D79